MGFMLPVILRRDKWNNKLLIKGTTLAAHCESFNSFYFLTDDETFEL